MKLTIFDVEHGACALVRSPNEGRIALVDCGTNNSTGWTPSWYIRNVLRRDLIDYLLITNADQDHYANLAVLKENIRISTFYKNPTLSSDAFENIKLQSGPLSRDALAYKEFLEGYTGPVQTPFDDGMGGIELTTFWNNYPTFSDTNNLSMAVFLRYGSFQILFPGDLERAGWIELLAIPEFKSMLSATTILVASHHGRENGYCREIFAEWGPRAVIVSDKPIVHGTQNVPQYQNCLSGSGINVVGQNRARHVLTTRNDGAITFHVYPNGDFIIYISK